MITKEQILAMPAGRELDRTVALTVMGYEPSKMYADLVLKGAKAEYPKPYSTDISAAWEVLKAFNAYEVFYNTDISYVEVVREGRFGAVRLERRDIPEVICKAALLAVMGL